LAVTGITSKLSISTATTVTTQRNGLREWLMVTTSSLGGRLRDREVNGTTE
jgi:hypothetical protein